MLRCIGRRSVCLDCMLPYGRVPVLHLKVALLLSQAGPVHCALRGSLWLGSGHSSPGALFLEPACCVAEQSCRAIARQAATSVSM